MCHLTQCSDVNKDLGFKAKDKDWGFQGQDLELQGQRLELQRQRLELQGQGLDILSRPRTQNLVLEDFKDKDLNI